MARKDEKIKQPKCEIFNEIDNDGIDEYRFRVLDGNDKIILSSSTRYYQVDDAIREFEQVIFNIKENPEAFDLKRTKNKRWYFNVIDKENETIARRIQYYDVKKHMLAEIKRIRDILTAVDIPIIVIGEPKPCKKDEKLCDLRKRIYFLYNECFGFAEPNLEKAISCAREILLLIQNCQKTDPGYKLTHYLKAQISAVSTFIDKHNIRNYVEAREAIQEIIDYLFERGDCDCEDEPKREFELKDHSALQSPHLYLQASGSTGNDSTRGMHLRWALKGALINHLPKGDYAATNANFNKPDDYVRIYRSPYMRHGVRISFEERPHVFDHGLASWTYSVSGNAFHVNFLNTAKYNEVLQTIDPAANPFAFVKAYGYNVIEVEHKTKLSFAITPQISITGGNSYTYVELQSVESNTHTAERLTTFRKKYKSVNVNHKQLLSENIRSARFKVSEGFLFEVEFEFYSNFIDAASHKKAWTYLGRHALTKNTQLAFSRLEPQNNSVHGKWLRYNDEAYVNIANYKDRWNGAGLPPENRIVNIVNTYINLSNNVTNPRAIETFVITEPPAAPDPDYNPSDDEGELSNLYVLQLAALDYHNARMLGLGILDLENQIMNGRYMYLAEYVTTANLRGGGKPREVQHIYCSLPTELADERLPVPIDLKDPVPGIIADMGTEAPQPITDANGYAHDGKTRFFSLFHELLHEEVPNKPFFYTNYEFSSAERTLPVYAGIEYRNSGDPKWQKPELPFDGKYLNIDSTVGPNQKNETKSIIIPDPGFPLFVHRERTNGWHDYSSYGINWFSRATSSAIVKTVETNIVPTNNLQPPNNINAVLIRPESPLLLTSADEQAEIGNIGTPDKTFIRLTFEYNHGHEMINYHRKIDGEVVSGYSELNDADELFGEDFEIYFRNRVPISISGKISSVTNTGNPILANVQTDEFVVPSSGMNGLTPNEVFKPTIIGNGSNYVGSVLSVDGSNFIIHQVDNSGTYPKFTVFKNDADGFPIPLGSSSIPDQLYAPNTGTLFVSVENMLTPNNWSLPDPAVSTVLPVPLPNPLGFRVKIDHTTVHNEEITITTPDGTVETHKRKFRGIYRNALIEKELEDTTGDDIKDTHLGLYKITFTGFNLAQHSQNAGPGHRVNWFNGIVRIHTQGEPNGPRKVLKVIRTENIGTASDLIIYAADTDFDALTPANLIPIGNHKVNYYPGYKTYLYHDPTHNLDEPTILPATDEGIKYSIFGLRTRDTGLNYYSKISQPILMYAQEIVEPLQPRLPLGGLYATRPDYFGKATYTFKTIFEHKPYSVQFKRASDIQMLSVIYKADEPVGAGDYNVTSVMEDILENRKSEWITDRWNNFLSFDYTADAGLFEKLPNDPSGVRFPLPNNPNFIASINAFIDGHNDYFNLTPPNQVPQLVNITSMHQVIIPQGPNNVKLELVDFMRDAIFNCFVPLTEIPVVYKHIKGGSYKPIPKKQTIRNRNGELLNPNDPEFDMAPMMKITGTGAPNHETQFTDFGLDGASNAMYFYVAREMNLQMKTGPYSPVLGPVSLVNAAPPTPPEIVKITPILENMVLNIIPGIEVQINAYPKSQNIKKIAVYRATAHVDALSIRTMSLVSEINVETANIANDSIWKIKDEFSDLSYVPYGDPLFYRIIVEREVKYKDKDGNLLTEYVPSESSKLTLTNIVENKNPEAPKLTYYSDPLNAAKELDTVTLVWDKKVHNGTYTIHKMNNSGNWEQIHEIQSNNAVVQVELVDTDLASNILPVEDANGNAIFHHFKVISKNFAGMISSEEKVLAIYDPATWKDISTL